MESFQNMPPPAGLPGDLTQGCPRPVPPKGAATRDLWRDGLLCAYEYIPASVESIKVGGDFGTQAGPVQGRFDAEITVKQLPGSPAAGGAVDLTRSHDSSGGASDDLRTGSSTSGRSSHDAEVQGFVVRESLQKDEADGGDELAAVSPSSSGRRPRRGGSKRERRSRWVPIGWARLTELFQMVQADPDGGGLSDDDETMSAADLARPYWQMRSGPTFWCHFDARHPKIQEWLAACKALHPAVSVALRDEKRLISDRMKHLLYEVPVRVAGGLLFELTGHSIGDPTRDEEDVLVVLRSWQSQNFLITSMHVKGVLPNLNVLGVMEVQDMLGAGGTEAPKCVQEVVAQLASRLARWDDRMSRKHFFGAADEVELKYVNRKGNEDLALLSIILNQEIRRLSTQVIRIKWSLHAREEILHELTTHLKGGGDDSDTQRVLAGAHEQTRQMLDEQEAVRARLFTVQDVMQSNVREKLQEKSVLVQHNLAVFGGGGLLLSIIVGLFGVNLDGIPGAANAPHAFAIFSAWLLVLGAAIVGAAMSRLGLRAPPSDDAILSRKRELQAFVDKFQKAAEAHEKVVSPIPSFREGGGTADADADAAIALPPPDEPNDCYVLLQ